MSIKRRMRSLFLCLALFAGSLGGVPMRPEEIEDLMHTMNEQKLTVSLDDETEAGKYKLPKLDGEPE